MQLKNVRISPNVSLIFQYFNSQLFNCYFSIFTFLITFFAGAFLMTFLIGAFATGLITTFASTFFAIIFLPIYFESSKARIGTKTILMNKSPSPNVRCFQNLFVILKRLMMTKTMNTGGNNIHRKFHPDRPPTLKIR